MLRRVEAGETLVVTVAGRPVAELGPARRRRWVKGAALDGVFASATPRTLDEALARFPIDLADPFSK